MSKFTLLGLSAATAILIAGCGNGDTTGGAAESAAELSKKSENAKPLNDRDKATLSRAAMPGGSKKGG